MSERGWEIARQQLLVKEKAFTRSLDALAAERRQMPRMKVKKKYEFDGPKGKVSLLDPVEGGKRLIVYRAFFEAGVFGFVRTQLPRLLPRRRSGHPPCPPNARDTTLAYASRALQARMGWEMLWYTITDSFDKDFGVDDWHGHNVFFRNGERGFPHILRQQPGRRSAASYANPIELSFLGGAKIARAIVNLVLNVSAKGSAARVVVT